MRERDAIESIRPSVYATSFVRQLPDYGSPGATPKASARSRRGKQMSERLILSLSAFSLAKEDQVNENA